MFLIKATFKSITNKNKHEDGFALAAMLTIFGVLAILTTLAIVILPITENDTHQTNREAASANAIYIAEAGINDYIWHLNKDENYYKNSIHPAQGKDEQGNDKWKAFQDGYYHLEVIENTSSPGVSIISTGKLIVNNTSVTKKVKAKIAKKSFTRYLYFTEYEKSESGNTIWFITGDVIKGPLHTNDYIHINGNPVFEQKVSTSKTLDIANNSHPDFQQGYEEHAPILTIPPTNADLKTWAIADGYYYYGKTDIELLPSGNITITNNNQQGKKGTVSLPPNGVIYVDGLTDAKGTANNGDIFIKGTIKGKLTIAAKNNIYITGDILYSDNQNDMLGLIAENYVYILHYWSNNGNPPYNVDVAPNNLSINAAIFTVNKSFGFESYNMGSIKGTLTIKGSIAQRYRGAVGTFSGNTKITGYTKNYLYDQRMLYSNPPHFIEPLNSGFEIISWEEL